MKPPCNQCKQIGCGAYHDNCEAYQEYKRKRKKITEKLTDDAFLKGYEKDRQIRKGRKGKNHWNYTTR